MEVEKIDRINALAHKAKNGRKEFILSIILKILKYFWLQ